MAKYIKEEVLTSLVVGKEHLLMPSDRDGFMQLYLYTLNGTLERKIGTGKADITAICAYDEASGDIFFAALNDGPTDQQVLVNHKNGKTDYLSPKKGWSTASCA